MTHKSFSNHDSETGLSECPNNLIRDLNDAFRMSGGVGGHLMITQGILALGDGVVAAIVQRVMTFAVFTPDNDPYGEHDFGAFDHDGKKIFWKIDCYARDLAHGSEDPSNPDVTTRVLTIMLAEEY